MRVKLDENIPKLIKAKLESLGWDVHTVFDEFLAGKGDSAIAQACQDEQRILMTLDFDFADIRTYPPEEYGGIIVLRPYRQSPHLVSQLLDKIVHLLETETLVGTLWIVEPSGVRIR